MTSKRAISCALTHMRWLELLHQSCRWLMDFPIRHPKKISIWSWWMDFKNKKWRQQSRKKTFNKKYQFRSHPPVNVYQNWWMMDFKYGISLLSLGLMDFKNKKMPTTHRTRIRENDHTFVQCLDLYLSKTLIDFKGPRQRCLRLHQFTTFIFCLKEKRNHTVHAVLSDLMKLQDCCLPWPPLLLELARSVAAPGPSQTSRPPPFHRLRFTDMMWLMVCPPLRQRGWQGPNIQTSMRWISHKSPGADARKAQVSTKVN